MLFHSHQIKGIGRGKQIGCPTINLEIPKDFGLDAGVYSSWVVINDKTYKGALHYGPIPTFNQPHSTMEVHLIDITDDNFPKINGQQIEIDIVEKIRDILTFSDSDELIEHIGKDIKKIKSMLKF